MSLRNQTVIAVDYFLWALVGALSGVIFGTMMDLAPRKVLFSIMAGAGIVTLFKLNIPRSWVPTTSESLRLPAGERVLLEAKEKIALPERVVIEEVKVEEKKNIDNEKMAPDEARKWLNDLLLSLQK